MKAIDTTKKSDWHRADIVAALHKSGWSLRQLSIAHGLHPTTLAGALNHPYPKAERLIARAIGVSAQEIWPSRYDKRAKRFRASQSNAQRLAVS